MFFSRSKSKLGIDIGTSSIKVAQIKKEEGKSILETYGIVNVSSQSFAGIGPEVIDKTAEILKTLLSKSSITTKKAVASLPNNIVFVSVIDMPRLVDKELQSAIEWEARRYVPLPLEEVTLSWSVLKDTGIPDKLKVLITAVPTTVIENYLKMFKLAGLEPEALEIEALALIRSLVGSRQDAFMIIDIGARNTSLNLVDKGFLQVSRNLSLGGENITSSIASSLRVSFSRAEEFKRGLGVQGPTGQVPETVRTVLDSIKREAEGLMSIYENKGGKIQEIILAGGDSQLPGLAEFFSDLGAKVQMGNPLKFVSFNETIKASLEPLAPSLSIALGLAMRD